MKKFYIDEVPDGLRGSFFQGRAFTIYDTECEKMIAYLDVLDSKVRVRNLDGEINAFSNVRDALQSLDILHDSDIPDFLFLQLEEPYAISNPMPFKYL